MESKILFLGMPGLGSFVLRALVRGGFDIAGCLWSDPSGGVDPSIELARHHGVPIRSWKDPDSTAAWIRSERFIVGLVASFDHILPPSVFDVPPLGFVNIHPGRLPQNRGPTPTFWSIDRGESETAVTFHRMVERADAGPVIASVPLRCEPRETLGSLSFKTGMIAARAARRIVPRVLNRTATYRAQNESAARWRPRPRGNRLCVPWHQSLEHVDRRIRALTPNVGARAFLGQTEVRIFESKPIEEDASAAPGTILGRSRGGGWLVAVGGKRLDVGTPKDAHGSLLRMPPIGMIFRRQGSAPPS